MNQKYHLPLINPDKMTESEIRKDERKKILEEITIVLDDFSASANTLIKSFPDFEKTGQEIHENIGFIKSKLLKND